MKAYPAKTEKKDLTKKDRKEIRVDHPMPFFGPFLSFRYSSHSIFSDGEKTHIRATENRFENGRFESETFEGTMAQNVYDQMARHMQSYLSMQMKLIFAQFSSFLPGPAKDKGRSEK